MFNIWQDPIVRAAKINDDRKLTQLLRSRGFSQRHLGWESPLSWLGKEPFFVLEDGGEILGALACPPDEDGICWLRLFASRAGFPPGQAWDQLWMEVQTWIEEHQPGLLVNSLIIKPEMKKHLPRSGFREVNQVVVLVWNSFRAQWPAEKKDFKIREMGVDDLPAVHGIDLGAFNLIWRHSLSQLSAAFQEAYSATVIDLDGKPAAYQISTTNPQGGHLARLAVDPAYQNQGLATHLLDGLLRSMEGRGIVEVTVNTQADNLASLDLYQKFGFKRLAEVYPVYQYSTFSE